MSNTRNAHTEAAPEPVSSDHNPVEQVPTTAEPSGSVHEPQVDEGDRRIPDREVLSRKLQLLLSSRYSGPLPPPRTLEKYNEIVEGGAERVFLEFERMGAHSREMERLQVESQVRRVEAQVRQEFRGQLCALAISLVALGCFCFAVYMDTQWAAGALGASTIASLAAVFVYGRKERGGNSEKGSDEPKPSEDED